VRTRDRLRQRSDRANINARFPRENAGNASPLSIQLLFPG
jgi:hypothetical protein